MEGDLTGEVRDRSHLDHGLAGDCGGCHWGEGKAGTSQGEALYGRRRHGWRAECSSYPAGKGSNHQSLGSMLSSCRTGLEVGHASGSRRNRDVEEARGESPAEGSQACDNLWQVVAVAGSHSTYRAEVDSSGKGRLLCTKGNPAVLGSPWRAEFYRSRGRRCGDLRDACFLRGLDILCVKRSIS